MLDQKILSVYDEIIDNWSVEALREKESYFYYPCEVEKILNGSKNIVIGRKGTGKSSIAKYLYELEKPSCYSEKLSFKNFPFNILYSFDNRIEYTTPNQYISIWKLLIYSYVCRLMIKNENVNPKIRKQLEKLYGEAGEKSIDQLLEKWTANEFGIEILGCGFSVGCQPKECKISWVETITILEGVVKEYCDNSSYFILFDELDEDYKEFSTEKEKDNYYSMLTSLIKATQIIRNIFMTLGKNVFPVVFLRSDIYTQIRDSDKNKWKESCFELLWETDEIKKMLAHRLQVAFNSEQNGFCKTWDMLFSNKKVRMGNRQSNTMDIYSYIQRSTDMRPRDFIQYVKEAVSLAKKRREYPITPQTVKDADEKFSEYLYGETIDELYPIIPEIEEVLGLLSTIRKQTFGYDEFSCAFEEAVKNNEISNTDVRKILNNLFEAGVIGNSTRMNGKTIFSFDIPKPRFNYNDKMIVHRGLYKALQIF